MATVRHFYLDQGSTFETTVSLVDTNNDALDVDGYSVRSSFRKYTVSNTAYPITSSLDTEEATVTLTIDANTTEPLTPGSYVYDVEIYADDLVYRVLEGTLVISPEVTRS